jgi:D-serine deaminase-like pyridoxal phosphate-dependent protein
VTDLDRLIGDLETPAPLLDLERVRANALRAVEYCAAHGIAWRPHVKTHKSLNVARIQLEAGVRGLTVATPREAEVMAEVCDDLLLAYPALGPSKLGRLMALPERVRLTVGLDSGEALDQLSAASEAAGRTTGVLVEADMGMGRVGLPGVPDVVALARRAAEAPGIEYRGIMFYPGHIRTAADEQDDGLAEVNGRLAALLTALAEAGLPAEIVSGGSTPTLWRSHDLDGVTEVRAGTAIFNDRDILAMGACRPEDLAYSVVATVVSTATPGKAVLDSGSKALAKESFRSLGGGFGFVLEHPEVEVAGLSEEHGVLSLEGSDWEPKVGERVRVIPNHVCVSVNLQDRYLVDTGSGLEIWPIEGRGRTPWAGVGG